MRACDYCGGPHGYSAEADFNVRRVVYLCMPCRQEGITVGQAESWSDLIEQVGQYVQAHPKESIGAVAEEFALSYDDAEEALCEYGKRHSEPEQPAGGGGRRE